MERTYPEVNEAVIEVERQKFLDQRCSVDKSPSSTASTHNPSLNTRDQFVPRSTASEQQRNTVTVAESSKMLIRTKVLTEILARSTDLVVLENRTWNKGGRFGTQFCFMVVKIFCSN